MANLETSVGGIPLESCIYNASGPRCGTDAALVKVAESGSAVVLSKSATVAKQSGNPLPRAVGELGSPGAAAAGHSVGSINSEGLPNSGIGYYLDGAVVDAVTKHGKPYFVSLSGKTLDDNLAMLEQALATDGVASVELNLACPNVIGKPIIAYDFEQMAGVLQAVGRLKSCGAKPLGIKLPPYFDGPHFQRAADILNACPFVNYVVSINTIGNALVVDGEAEQPLICPKGGFGGLAGPLVKYTALANVRKMRQLLRDDIDVVGVGGVRTGMDAFELILCGASAVQLATCHWNEGPSCFGRVAGELQAIMARKGYGSIRDFQGQLKDFDKARHKESLARKKKETAAAAAAAASKAGGGGAANKWHIYVIIALLSIIAALVVNMRRMGQKIDFYENK